MIETENPDFYNVDRHENYYYNRPEDKSLIPEDRLQIGEELKSGNFGVVFKGYYRIDPEPGTVHGELYSSTYTKSTIVDDDQDFEDGKEIYIDVAIKFVRQDRAPWGIYDKVKKDFMKEKNMLNMFAQGNYHTVKYHGCTNLRNYGEGLVMEYVEGGDLRTWVKQWNPSQEQPEDLEPPSLKRLMKMAADIADGMHYLSSMGMVHMDLAARNCLVQPRERSDDGIYEHIKICDYGLMAKLEDSDYYRVSDERQKPIMWYAPEVLVKKQSKTQSDVWSYGVLLYEIASLGERPYSFPDHSSHTQYDHCRIMAKIKENLEQKYYEFNCISDPEWRDVVIRHLGQLGISRDDIEIFFFKLMRDCFAYDPDRRPTFHDIMESFMVDQQIQSVWTSGEDEPHPLKDERYEKCYFFNVLQQEHNDRATKSPVDPTTSDTHGSGSSNESSELSPNDKTPLLPKQQ